MKSWRALALRAFLILASTTLGVITSSATAATPSAAWSIDSFAYPSNFSADDNVECLSARPPDKQEHCDTYDVTVTDSGAKPTVGTTVTITDTLPPGLTVRNVFLRSPLGAELNIELSLCTIVLSVVKCTIPTAYFTKAGPLKPDEAFKLYISVTVDEPGVPGPLANAATVSGGGAPEASTSNENTVALATAPFGLSGFGATMLGTDGAPASQAGAHPYELPTRLDLNTAVREDPEAAVMATSVQDLRDVVVDLPLGIAASALAAPTCTLVQLSAGGVKHGVSGCPADTVVGHIRTYPEGFLAANGYIFNILPEHGVAAELGFVDNSGATHVLYASLAPTPAGYVLRSTTREVPQIRIIDIAVEIYGDPAARARALQASKEGLPYTYSTKPSDVPMFTNPAHCSGEPLKTTIHLDSWQAPGYYNPDGTPDFSDPNWASASSRPLTVTGCDQLEGLFNPTISAIPESTQASSPTGLEVDLKIPQNETVETLATPPLREAVVTLPEGMTVNPSSANGLGACSEAEVGISSTGLPNAAPPTCPNSSKIGTVEVETPALPTERCKDLTKSLSECPAEGEREKTPLQGAVYLAKQTENPFGSLLAAYFVIDDPRSGVIVKLPAKVELNEATGQVKTVVPNGPQLPFSVLRTHIFGGARASLSTPATCGSFMMTSTLTPWSAPESGPPAQPSSPIEVTQGAGGGGACPGTRPFAPSFAAGTSNSQAGGFAPLNLSISRQDNEQDLAGVSVTTPPGLLGSLKSVVQCPEPQASTGACGPESLLGEAITAVGTGPEPYWVYGGKVYLTGPYNGGPFGLSIVVPTTAGPFTLIGNAGFGKEVVRSSIRVNPTTSQITVVSDPLPQIIQGIPLHVRTINVMINRPNFTFNPTSCSPLSVSASIASTSGATAGVSSPFKAQNCANLPFHPTFEASTSGKASKANGTSLSVKLTFPHPGPRSGSQSGEANIHSVHVELPKSLPARLTTLQKACTAAQFESNPAGCPKESIVGHAIAHTLILTSPLQGPAYFVSHGGAKFPELILVLQGEGITIDLAGETFINGKTGVTSSTFASVPDAPVSGFELVLPQGPFSALTANGNLCTQNLVMPTKFVAQNGAVLNQNTHIEVEGCSNTLSVVSKKVKGRTLTLGVWVPAAGRLSASGKGLSKASKASDGRKELKLTLRAARHHKFTTKIRLVFTPSSGKERRKLGKSVTVKFGR